MQTVISPYLIFKGNCAEAMNFYKECLGAGLSLMLVKDTAMAAQMPPHMQNNAMHAALTRHGATLLLASDMGCMGEPDTKGVNNMMSITITCPTLNEMNGYFNKISQGAVIGHEVHEFPDGFIGDLNDKFGMSWIFYSGK